MELPIESEKLNIILIGEALPVMVYGTNEQKKDASGQLVFKAPVLIQGTGSKQDPTTTITYSGSKLSFPNGTKLVVKDLSIFTWSLRGNNGQMRNGFTLRAKHISSANSR